MAPRSASILLDKPERFSKLGDDQHPPRALHPRFVLVELRDDTPDQFGRFSAFGQMLVGVVLHRKKRLVSLGPHKPEPERVRGDAIRLKVDSHVHRHFIDGGFPHSVRRSVEIAAAAKG